jgi:xanthine dehydrogenase accessory factor
MGEFLDISRAAAEALARGETVALATVVRVRGSAPRHISARMLVWPDGRAYGTIGGGTLELRAVADAQAALGAGQPAFKSYTFDTRGGPDSVGLCGGVVDVHLDVLRPDPTLLLIGAGHIAQPLARMAHMLGQRVIVVDDRPDWASLERFPAALERHHVAYEESSETLGPIPVAMNPATYVVIATWGYDLPALEQALRANPAFIGLVASPTKAREFFRRLLQRGFSPADLRRVHTPLGLDIGAESPAELALSILAAVLAAQRGADGGPLTARRGQALEKLLAEAEAEAAMPAGEPRSPVPGKGEAQ